MAKVDVDTGPIERALALLGRGAFSQNDVAVIAAGAAELERRGEPYTRVEGKLLDLAENLTKWGRPAPRD